MTEAKDSLIIYAKLPKPGQVKTRLIPRLGEEGAAELYDRIAHYIFNLTLRHHLDHQEFELRIDYDGGTQDEMEEWVGPGFELFPQVEGDLGQRMTASMQLAFERGAQKVVLIGTDCPQLTVEIVRQAFDELDNKDLVLGPSLDGGYYLIGMKAPQFHVMEDIPWSTEAVLSETMKKAQGLKVGLLPELMDLDTPEDLESHLPWFPWLLPAS